MRAIRGEEDTAAEEDADPVAAAAAANWRFEAFMLALERVGCARQSLLTPSTSCHCKLQTVVSYRPEESVKLRRLHGTKEMRMALVLALLSFLARTPLEQRKRKIEQTNRNARMGWAEFLDVQADDRVEHCCSAAGEWN